MRALVVLLLATLAANAALTQAKKLKRQPAQKAHFKRHSPVEMYRQSQCDDKSFNCSSISCIPEVYTCDMESDCYNGADEANCPTDCSGEHQFKCDSDSKCISHRKHCDGQPDCLDWSDEWHCKEFECLEGFTHCTTSQECIKEEYRCDGDADCRDGSDEQGCPTNACYSHQFHCASGTRQCIPNTYVCDSDKDCSDGSDEVGCTCRTGEMACNNGGCVDASWKCDGDNDCGDMSDEVNCPEAPDHQCFDVLTGPDCLQMNETAHPICLIYADAHKFCRKFCNMCGLPAGSAPPATSPPMTTVVGGTPAPTRPPVTTAPGSHATTPPSVIEIGG